MAFDKKRYLRIMVAGGTGVAVTRGLELTGIANFAVFMGIFMGISLLFNTFSKSDQDEGSEE